MGIIHVLDENIANRIAAGEVVERPSGVVKELVENAIDAGSTRIEVNILEGGISSIEVIDNGCGMDKADAILAFERHATSKIRNDMDLWNIHTLGFRGEALASIASVAEVEMYTCNGEDSTHVIMNNGKTECVERAPMRKGTQFIVRNLFFKIPARLKYLKSPQYESAQILEILQKLALGNPHIAFVMHSENKEVFRSSGSGDLKDTLYGIYGKDTANSAMELHAADTDFKVDGYVCLPTQTRSTKKLILFFMNNRVVNSYYLQSAVMKAYEDYIPEKKFPLVFLHIVMDAKLVDVNVHPNKLEVRLSKEKQLWGLVESAVHKVLRENMNKQGSLISEIDLHRAEKEKFEEQSLFVEYKEPVETKKDYSYLFSNVANSMTISKNVDNYATNLVENDEESVDNFKNTSERVQNCESALSADFEPFVDSSVEAQNDIVENNEENVENDFAGVEKINDIVENTPEVALNTVTSRTLAAETNSVIPFEVIGQLHGSYILASNNDGLVIIDQHAANERIRYEKLKHIVDTGTFEVQQLLIPLVITINKAFLLQFDKLKEGFKELGLDIDTFGDSEIIVREIPIWMNDVDNQQSYILDLIDDIMADKTLEVSLLKKHAIATYACHHSIRFNRALTKLEMEETIRQLFECENPYHCPHGRPTYIVYENDKLRKLFERG